MGRALESPAPALDNTAIARALTLSLITTLISAVIIVVFGTALAYVLARWRLPFQRAVSTLIELPIVMPPAVAGLALLIAFGRYGVFGGLFNGIGLQLSFSRAAVVLAQVFVAAPFYIRAAQICVFRACRVSLRMRRASMEPVSGEVLPAYSRSVCLARLIQRLAAKLGTGTRRIRRDDPVCGQPERCHPNHAAVDLHGLRKRSHGVFVDRRHFDRAGTGRAVAGTLCRNPTRSGSKIQASGGGPVQSCTRRR